MTVKRSRTGNDSELEPSAPPKSPLNQTAVRFPPSRNVAPPPVQECIGESSSQSNLGSFLERCQYCRKRIPEGVEVFMYRDFCAFCSIGCRDIQISLDRLAERQAVFYQERVIQDMKNVKSHPDC